ncbi:MAG: class I SAM-dependent methyltransferase [Gammaproteobacteria bacterium]|nr:class I SAM-dependent methyltransferase [Gammaproteobacteria bacterium]
MNANKALWEKGDFTKIAETMRDSGTELIGKIGINSNHKVLDLGCGDGTTAIPAARLGADVLGVDIARNLVKAGNARAALENLDNCKFQEGDACQLGELADNSFDRVISIFGAMFAPEPQNVAKEMVRVARPGGQVVMGNWIPNDPTLVAQILKTCSAYAPPPPKGFISPMTWGVQESVTERFVSAGIEEENISFIEDTFTFSASISPSKFSKRFLQYYGPTMNALEAAAQAGKAADLEQELEDLFNTHNKSTVTDAMLIPATFLRVTVSV